MSAPTNEQLAQALYDAAASGMPIAPLTEARPGLTIDDAYAIQAANAQRRRTEGGRRCGRKIGLTSKAMQEQLGVDQPDYGVLFDDMAVADGDSMPATGLIAPKVEAELAFVMATDLQGPGVDALAVRRAVAGVVGAIEIIDSRVADWRIALPDTIADNASSARYVLGTRMLDVGAIDLTLTGVVLTHNGRVTQTGAGAAVLGDPLRCVAWLANALGRHGDGLRAGDVVLSGALHAAVAVAPGDQVQARFAHLGSVTTGFAQERGA